MPRCTQLRIIASLCFVAAFLTVPALAQPVISQATPFSVKVGQPTEIDLVGDKLAGPLQIVTSFPAQVEIVSQEAQKARIRITTPPETPSQIAALVACTAEGATDAFWVVVDDLPTILDQGTNHQLAAAQEITYSSGVDGTADGTEADYYRVPLQAGQRLAVDTIASRFGSACDPVVRLLTPEGQELLAIDDIEGHGGDCHFEYVAKGDGPVIIELRDNKYQSGVRYRLRVGDLPLTLASLPLGVRRGSTVQVRLPAFQPDQSFASIVSANVDRWATRLPMNARSAAGSTSLAELAISDVAEYTETEPNDDPQRGTELSVPCGISGVISDPNDRDVFLFAAKTGQQLIFRTTARSFGSPAFPLLRLLNSANQLIAESAYADSDEVSLAFSAPADGIYQLHVDELTQRGGPQFVYRVEISDVPFRLLLKNVPESQFRLAGPRGDGAVAIDLQVERFGYNGPIRLSVEPASAGIDLFQSTIPAGAAEHRLFVAFDETMPVGSLRMLRVVGHISNGNQEQHAAASTTIQLRTKWPSMTPIPGWHEGLFLVSATPAASPIFRLQANTNALYVPRGNGTTQIVITGERLNAEYKDPLTFVTGALPDGITAAAAAEGDKFTVTLTNAGNTAVSTENIALGFYGTFGGRPQLAQLSVPLEINDPLSLAADALPVQVKPGTTEKLKVTVVRRGTDRQPVNVEFQNLPAGITIAAATIPADQDTLEIDVTAAAETAAGTYEATLAASSQYAGQPSSASGKLTITVPAP